MSNKERILAFYQEVFNGLDAQAAGKYLAEDYIQHNPDIANGRQGFIDSFEEKFKKGFPYLDIQHVICEGDMVCVHHFGRNRQTNEVICWISDIYRFENGLLAEHWDCIQRVI